MDDIKVISMRYEFRHGNKNGYLWEGVYIEAKDSDGKEYRGMLFPKREDKFKDFNERFETDDTTGAFLMKTTAMFGRHTLSRAEQEIHPREEGKWQSRSWMKDEAKCQQILTELPWLLKRFPNETLEKIVEIVKESYEGYNWDDKIAILKENEEI